MLGKHIHDPETTESSKKQTSGLGFLPVVTAFEKEKTLSQVKAEEITSGVRVTGYEIHHGKTRILNGCGYAFRITERQGKRTGDFDGALSEDGRIWGTYMHGVFDEDNFRRSFLNKIRLKKGWRPLSSTVFELDKEFDKLADLVRENVDMDQFYEIMKYGI